MSKYKMEAKQKFCSTILFVVVGIASQPTSTLIRTLRERNGTVLCLFFWSASVVGTRQRMQRSKQDQQDIWREASWATPSQKSWPHWLAGVGLSSCARSRTAPAGVFGSDPFEAGSTFVVSFYEDGCKLLGYVKPQNGPQQLTSMVARPICWDHLDRPMNQTNVSVLCRCVICVTPKWEWIRWPWLWTYACNYLKHQNLRNHVIVQLHILNLQQVCLQKAVVD